ncbi:MAG: universal stress protein [candidate division WOR-3 bacterium]
MYKKILVPVDFSQASRVALEYAKLLISEKGQITVMHVFPSKIRETATFFEIPDRVKDLERKIEELRSKSQEELSRISNNLVQEGYTAKAVFVEGEPVRSVSEESGKGYDLVIVGIPKGRAMVASTAISIVKSALPSCLVVKESKSKPKFDRVLFTADFSDASKSAFKDLFQKFIKKFESQITVLNVFELHPLPYIEQGSAFLAGDLEGVKKNLQKRLMLEYPGEVSYSVVEGAEAGIEIVDFAEKGKYNIIILAYEKKDWVERAFLGSVSTKVVKMTRLPVLVYKRV